MIRNLYNRRDWILGVCTNCQRTNYVEPHGTTAQCICAETWTEHLSIPYEARVGGLRIHVDTRRIVDAATGERS